jgi:hypothetical protein
VGHVRVAKIRTTGVLAHVEHEIEPRREVVASVGHSHHQLAAEQAVTPVRRLVRKIELRGEHALLWRLHLDVIVAGAAGVERRQDGPEAIAALGVGEQVSAIAESASVVLAALVGVPEIDERPRNRPAGAGENLSVEFDQPRLAARLDEIGALGRGGFEIWPFGLTKSMSALRGKAN